MKVICIINMGTVDEVVVCNDEDEQRIVNELADANDKLDKDDRVHIRSLTPSATDAVIDYISTI